MKFVHETGITIHTPDRDPIRINAGEPYETDDSDLADLIRAQPGVEEVSSGSSQKDE